MRLLIIALLLLPLGCVSEEGIQQTWDDFVADNNACETADDCTIVYPSCPLGCYSAVSAESAEAAADEAERLIKKYERGGRSCAYSCAEAPDLLCDDGRCQLAEE